MAEAGIHFLDDEVVELDDLRIAGLSGIIGRPTKPWRRSEADYVAALGRLLADDPDLLVLHDGPNAPLRNLRGTEAIRVALESSRRQPLIIRGHAHWVEPIVELANGAQVLNVDARVVVLQTGAAKRGNDR